MGVLSALPLVNLGNLCCCFWVVSGGLVAAYLLQQGRPDAITPSEGAIVGLLAGIVGAFVQFLVSIPIGLIVAPLERGLMQRAADMAGNMPPALREAFGSYSGQRAGLGFVALLCVRIMGLHQALGHQLSNEPCSSSAEVSLLRTSLRPTPPSPLLRPAPCLWSPPYAILSGHV